MVRTTLWSAVSFGLLTACWQYLTAASVWSRIFFFSALTEILRISQSLAAAGMGEPNRSIIRILRARPWNRRQPLCVCVMRVSHGRQGAAAEAREPPPGLSSHCMAM